METGSPIVLLDRRIIRSRSIREMQYLRDAATSGGLLGTRHTVVRDERRRITAEFDSHNLITTAGKNSLLGVGVHGDAQITTWYQALVAENRHVSDGVITAQPTTTFSSAAASFVAGDVGRQVTIFNGLAGPANFVGTIVSQTGTACVVSANLTLNGTGLIASIGPLFAAADTHTSHAGWAEVAAALLTNGVRPTWNPGAASGGSCTGGTTPSAFTMATPIATQYIHGFFTSSVNTLGSTGAGTLISEGEYSTGALVVGSSYTITDTYTLTLT